MTNNKFIALKSAASGLKGKIETIALYLEISSVLYVADVNTLATIEKQGVVTEPDYDGLFIVHAHVILAFSDSLSELCIEWFASQGMDIDKEDTE